MTSKEVVEAMAKKLPVLYNGIRYKRIEEYILTIDNAGEQRKSVSLLDMNGKSLVRALASQVILCPQGES